MRVVRVVGAQICAVRHRLWRAKRRTRIELERVVVDGAVGTVGARVRVAPVASSLKEMWAHLDDSGAARQKESVDELIAVRRHQHVRLAHAPRILRKRVRPRKRVRRADHARH